MSDGAGTMPSERPEWADLKERIKKHEGFVNKIYKDSLGKATIGYGHLITPDDTYVEDMEYDEDLLSRQFDVDFDRSFLNARDLMEKYDLPVLPQPAQEVLIEMVFQLGIGGVGKFKKMWAALEQGDFVEASDQMMDSRWHQQTTNRCEDLAGRMAACAIPT